MGQETLGVHPLANKTKLCSNQSDHSENRTVVLQYNSLHTRLLHGSDWCHFDQGKKENMSLVVDHFHEQGMSQLVQCLWVSFQHLLCQAFHETIWEKHKENLKKNNYWQFPLVFLKNPVRNCQHTDGWIRIKELQHFQLWRSLTTFPNSQWHANILINK